MKSIIMSSRRCLFARGPLGLRRPMRSGCGASAGLPARRARFFDAKFLSFIQSEARIRAMAQISS
jgi:hypothetical protein